MSAAVNTQPRRIGVVLDIPSQDVPSLTKGPPLPPPTPPLVTEGTQPTSSFLLASSTGGDNSKIPGAEAPKGSGSETGEVTKGKPKACTAQEVTGHKSENDLWIIIGSDIYDVTEFQHQHPGGAKILRGVAGKDATKKFDKYHRRGILEPYKPKYQVGVLVAKSSSPERGGGQADAVALKKKKKGGLFGKFWK